jgi:hypothetical protein
MELGEFYWVCFVGPLYQKHELDSFEQKAFLITETREEKKMKFGGGGTNKDLHLFVEVVRKYKAMCHAKTMWLHWMIWPKINISHVSCAV